MNDKKSIIITVPGIPPSNNKFIGRNARWEYQNAKTEWHWRVKAAIRERPHKPFGKSYVSITYYFPDRIRRDPDNYSGKFLLDAIRREGIIADDSFRHIELRLTAFTDRENPRTVIEITEV